MDYDKFNERNYRQVELVRQRNTREIQRLEATLYGKRGMVAFHKSRLDEMDKETDAIRRELSLIKKVTCTTWGELPGRDGELRKPRPRKRKKMQRRMSKMAAERKKRRGEEGVSRQTTGVSGVTEASSVFSTSDGEIEAVRRDNEARTFCSPSNENEATGHGENRDKLNTSGVDARPTKGSVSTDNMEKAKDNVKKRLISKRGQNTKESLKREPSKLFPRVLSPLQEQDKPAVAKNNPVPNRNTDKQGTVIPSFDEPEQSKLATKSSNSATRSKKLPKLTKEPSRTSMKKPSRESTRVDESGRKKPRGRKTSEGEEKKFDSLKYNPDGSLRTVHCLPDFMNSLHEAMRARYVRFKSKQWYEEAFTSEQIFDRKVKEKSLVLFKDRVEKAGAVTEA